MQNLTQAKRGNCEKYKHVAQVCPANYGGGQHFCTLHENKL